MKGYPKHLNTKQDIINILQNHPEFHEPLKADLQRLLNESDTVTVAVLPIDPSDITKGGNTKTIPNPNPKWKIMGFENKLSVVSMQQEVPRPFRGGNSRQA